MASNLLVDTGFWFALYDPSDSYHKTAGELYQYFEYANIIIPHPTLYETLNTRFVNNKRAMNGIGSVLARSTTRLVSDADLHSKALELVQQERNKKRGLSLVDIEIRLILSNPNYRIHTLVTFNTGDFADICREQNIEIWDC